MFIHFFGFYKSQVPKSLTFESAVLYFEKKIDFTSFSTLI